MSLVRIGRISVEMVVLFVIFVVNEVIRESINIIDYLLMFFIVDI